MHLRPIVRTSGVSFNISGTNSSSNSGRYNGISESTVVMPLAVHNQGQ